MEVVVGKTSDMMTRQEEIKEIASKVELIIVIGKKNNADTNEFYDISLKKCGNAMIVEALEDLYLNYIARFKKVGVIKSSSGLQDIQNKVLEILKDTQTKGYINERIK